MTTQNQNNQSGAVVNAGNIATKKAEPTTVPVANVDTAESVALPNDSFGDVEDFHKAKEAEQVKSAQPVEVQPVDKPADRIPESAFEADASDEDDEDDEIQPVAIQTEEQQAQPIVHVAVGSEETPVAQSLEQENFEKQVDEYVRQPETTDSSPTTEMQDDWEFIEPKLNANRNSSLGIEVNLGSNKSFAEFALSLAMCGVQIREVHSESSLDKIREFPHPVLLDANELKNAAPNYTALQVPTISMLARLPDSDDATFGGFDATGWSKYLLASLRKFESLTDSSVMVLVSAKHARITQENTPNVGKAVKKGRLVVLEDYLEENDAETIVGHDILIICSRNAGFYEFNFVGDISSDTIYFSPGTDEVFAPSLTLLCHYIIHLVGSLNYPVFDASFESFYHEGIDGDVWREVLTLTTIGDLKQIQNDINPIFASERILNNLNNNSNEDATVEARYEGCNISVVPTHNDQLSYLGQEVQIIICLSQSSVGFSDQEQEDEGDE